MNTTEDIRKNVRQAYGKAAENGGFKFGNTSSCCGSNNLKPDQISSSIGYSNKDLTSVPEGANLGLGCGNPNAIAGIKEGETVVDLGSGGGFDCFLAAQKVGPKGMVIGVDMTSEMVERARRNRVKAGAQNVEFRLGEIEHLPIADQTADLIISNCVINLSPEKEKVYADAFRVLKNGGRIAISDIVAFKPLPLHIRQDLALVSACIGGAATIDETKKMLEAVGFTEITITPKKVDPALVESCLPGSRVAEFVASADIIAKKPL